MRLCGSQLQVRPGVTWMPVLARGRRCTIGSGTGHSAVGGNSCFATLHSRRRLGQSSTPLHQDAAGGRGGPAANALGRSRGGFSTKIHAVVTLDGQPIELRLTPGQQHEATLAEELLEFVHEEHCLADGGYDADRILQAACDRELKAVIPPSRARRHRRRIDRELYRLRYRVEVFFHRLKRYRRIATRYDKTSTCFMGSVYVICAHEVRVVRRLSPGRFAEPPCASLLL